jgi:glucosylglycerate synthase
VALTDGTLLSDELLRQLMAVGQVDVMVGLPTLDNAATVGGVVQAVHTAFATHLKRERTVLVNVDGGSGDATPDIVRRASFIEGETLIAPQPLRTIHRISVPYHGQPGKGGALRTLFAAAELLDAKAVAVLDPDVTRMDAEWVAALVRPVLREGFDYVSPVFPRPPTDGLLVTQLARPLVRAAYGHRVAEPLATELGCSARFAAHALTEDVWTEPWVSYGIDVWLTTTALAAGFRCVQAALGPRTQIARPERPGLPELFRQIGRALFTCLERHESFWIAQEGSRPLEMRGTLPVFGPADAPDVAPLAAAFAAGVRDLAPVLERILDEETREGVRQAASREPPVYPDGLWASTVAQSAAAYHRGVIHRDHLIQSLVPLYLGRAASFVAEVARSGADGPEADLEALCLEFERVKPEMVRRWSAQDGR